MKQKFLGYILTIFTVILLNTSSKIYAEDTDKLYDKFDLFSEVFEKIQNEYV